MRSFCGWLRLWYDEKTPDLLDHPRTAYVTLPDQRYKAEQDLAEKYRSFVGEILRLSSAGLGVFALLQKGLHTSGCAGMAISGFAIASVLFFAGSIFFSFVFLFGASEGLRWYIVGLRCIVDDPQGSVGAMAALERRNAFIAQCRHSKYLAAIGLVFGAISMAIATALSMLFSSPEHTSTT